MRRVNISANRVVRENSVNTSVPMEQMDLFTDYEELERKQKAEQSALEREKKARKQLLSFTRNTERTPS